MRAARALTTPSRRVTSSCRRCTASGRAYHASSTTTSPTQSRAATRRSTRQSGGLAACRWRCRSRRARCTGWRSSARRRTGFTRSTSLRCHGPRAGARPSQSQQHLQHLQRLPHQRRWQRRLGLAPPPSQTKAVCRFPRPNRATWASQCCALRGTSCGTAWLLRARQMVRGCALLSSLGARLQDTRRAYRSMASTGRCCS
mmetsp:Transcript_2747/g.7453  ORF Transcript_2747/g.7453 Transcript_2747/m.7453 type:complete len:200 (-) Transcript_2747:401-1000(-)